MTINEYQRWWLSMMNKNLQIPWGLKISIFSSILSSDIITLGASKLIWEVSKNAKFFFSHNHHFLVRCERFFSCKKEYYGVVKKLLDSHLTWLSAMYKILNLFTCFKIHEKRDFWGAWPDDQLGIFDVFKRFLTFIALSFIIN